MYILNYYNDDHNNNSNVQFTLWMKDFDKYHKEIKWKESILVSIKLKCVCVCVPFPVVGKLINFTSQIAVWNKLTRLFSSFPDGTKQPGKEKLIRNRPKGCTFCVVKWPSDRMKEEKTKKCDKSLFEKLNNFHEIIEKCTKSYHTHTHTCVRWQPKEMSALKKLN